MPGPIPCAIMSFQFSGNDLTSGRWRSDVPLVDAGSVPQVGTQTIDFFVSFSMRAFHGVLVAEIPLFKMFGSVHVF